MTPIPEPIQKRIDHELAMAVEIESMARYADGKGYQQDMDEANRRRTLAARLKAVAEKDSDERRRRDLALIHTGCKAIGMLEADYRAMIFRLTNRRSAADLVPYERTMVVTELRRLGWTGAPQETTEPRFQGGSQVDFLRHLWTVFTDRGLAKVPGEDGLCRWVYARFKVQKPEWLNPSQLNAAIEAMKQMVARPARGGAR